MEKLLHVNVRGIPTPVQAHGDPNRDTAVVFLHGNPGASDDWAALLPRVGEFARALAPDMPGYGRAPRPRDFDYTIHGYAQHLGALLDAMGVRRAHLVLHDLGGFWGLQWAADHPDRVASLSLINTGLLPDYRWHKYARIWRTPVVGELFQLGTTELTLKLLLNLDNPKPLPDAFIRRMNQHGDWGSKRAVRRFYRATSDVGAFSSQVAAILAPRALPALVLWGEHDRYLPVRYAQVQARYFRAEVHTLKDCGHWPMIDEPRLVQDLLLPFLRQRLEAPARPMP